MAALGAEMLLPGHGLPIVGADRVRTALADTADLLESLHDQTLALMNEGARLDDDRPHRAGARRTCSTKPYLRPIYDEPEFVVRNVWRLYGGWYDGNPAHLKPAPDAALGRRGRRRSPAARGAGGAGARAWPTPATSASPATSPSWPAQAAPDDPACTGARAEVFRRRAAAERSLMAKGVFGWAAAESEDRATPAEAPPG